MQSLYSKTRQNRWVYSAVLALAIIGLVLTLWQSEPVRTARYISNLEQACAKTNNNIFQLYPVGAQPEAVPVDFETLQAEMSQTIAKLPGVEGGFWHPQTSFFGYAYPTYVGTDIRIELPESNQALVSRAATEASNSNNVVSASKQGNEENLVVVACPIKTHQQLAGWMMVHVKLVPPGMILSLSVLFAAIALVSIWLIVSHTRYNRRWHRERDDIVESIEDEATLVPLTTEIQELQPVLILLQRARMRAKQLEQQLQRESELQDDEKRLVEIGRLAASLANEAHAPLLQLQRKSQQLLNVVARTHKPRVEQLQLFGDRIERTLDGLLLLTERREYTRGDVDLMPWLTSIARSHHDSAQRYGVAVTAMCGDDVSFQADGLQLRYAIDMLVWNAMDFAPKDTEVLVRGYAKGGNIVIEVSDDSKGIEPKHRKHLFEANYYSDKPSYGVGLAAVQTIVEAHQGTVHYDALERGARFVIEIPMTSA